MAKLILKKWKPVHNEILLAYKSGAKAADTAKRLGMNLTYIYRVIASDLFQSKLQVTANLEIPQITEEEKLHAMKPAIIRRMETLLSSEDDKVALDTIKLWKEMTQFKPEPAKQKQEDMEAKEKERKMVIEVKRQMAEADQADKLDISKFMKRTTDDKQPTGGHTGQVERIDPIGTHDEGKGA